MFLVLDVYTFKCRKHDVDSVLVYDFLNVIFTLDTVICTESDTLVLGTSKCCALDREVVYNSSKHRKCFDSLHYLDIHSDQQVRIDTFRLFFAGC